MSATAPRFPLTAILAQDDLVTALLLCAVDPGLGGVLVRGERGTAKTTAVPKMTTHAPQLSNTINDYIYLIFSFLQNFFILDSSLGRVSQMDTLLSEFGRAECSNGRELTCEACTSSGVRRSGLVNVM